MSGVDGQIDLSGLSRSEEQLAPPRRGWLRIWVPVVIVLSFAYTLRDALGELLTERTPVTLTRPVLLEGQPEGSSSNRTVLVQAAGWVEPDPFLVHGSALAAGVVLEVLVQESDVVTAGAPLARMIDDDARIRRDEALGRVAVREAEVAEAAAQARIAEESFSAAIEVTAAHDAAKAMLAGAEGAAAHARSAVREGEARVSLAESEIEVQRSLVEAGSSGPRQVEIAEAELEVARGRLAALEAEAARALASVGTALAEVQRTGRHLELRLEEQLLVDTTRASLEKARGALDQARAGLEAAELLLDRMTVRAPQDGIVLERLAVAGDELKAGSPVCSLYDPQSLRIRVDVPQSDVEALALGQEAEILSDSRPGRPYAGRVLRIVQLADIQKVTLEAQVRVLDADELLRPDMLAQVRFYSSARPTAAPGSRASTRRRLAVPPDLVTGGAVWVHDPVGDRAVRRAVRTGSAVTGPDGSALLEIVEGIDWSVELIDEGRVALPADAGPEGAPIVVREATGEDAGGAQR